MPRPALTIVLALSVGLAAFFLISGESDTHASLTRASVATMTDIKNVVAKIQDEASAEAARPELERLNRASEELASRMKSLPAADKSALSEAEAHVKQYAAVSKEFAKQLARLEQKPAALTIVRKALAFYRN